MLNGKEREISQFATFDRGLVFYSGGNECLPHLRLEKFKKKLFHNNTNLQRKWQTNNNYNNDNGIQEECTQLRIIVHQQTERNIFTNASHIYHKIRDQDDFK